MKEGYKVRVISGENKGKIGIIKARIPMSQVQDLSPGKDISMEGAKILWVVEFEDEKQDLLEENSLEVIPPE